MYIEILHASEAMQFHFFFFLELFFLTMIFYLGDFGLKKTNNAF